MFTVHRVTRASFLAVAMAASMAATSPAWAATTATTASTTASRPPATYNNTDIKILGGDATTASTCVTLAQAYIRRHRSAPSSQRCRNFAEANAGSANLRNVDVLVDQEGNGGGHGSRTYNNADITISGGDASAFSDCFAYLQGNSSADQNQRCSAEANGGDANLRDVDITVVQTG
jgi:hypothetical protein